MKKWMGLLCLFLLSTVAQGNSIYLIRHAEKANDGTKDPALTEKGLQRAQNIVQMLSHAGISKVYATDYKRTQMTAQPMADYLGLEVLSYNPSELSVLVQQLKDDQANVLVVGHSNTTPQLAHLLSGEPVVNLTEADFDYLFQVIILGELATLNVLKSSPVNFSE